MRQAEAKAEAQANAEAKRQAESESAENEAEQNEQPERASQADFDAGDADKNQLSQTANVEESGDSTYRIGTIAEAATVVPAKPKASKPKWVKVKANAAALVKAKRPSIKDMIPIKSTPAADKESNVRPPAPSMAELYFEPLDDSAAQAQPLVAPMLRRPNEL